MAIGTIGYYDAAPGISFPSGITYLAQNDTATALGQLEKVTINAAAGVQVTATIAIYKPSPPNWTRESQATITIPAGAGEYTLFLSTPLSVNIGDHIAIYCASRALMGAGGKNHRNTQILGPPPYTFVLGAVGNDTPICYADLELLSQGRPFYMGAP